MTGVGVEPERESDDLDNLHKSGGPWDRRGVGGALLAPFRLRRGAVGPRTSGVPGVAGSTSAHVRSTSFIVWFGQTPSVSFDIIKSAVSERIMS